MPAEFQPTDDQRRAVDKLASYGVPQAEIAKVVGIDPKTLRKHFRDALDLGAVKANAAVAETAYRMAVSGEKPTMTVFWLKCRAGWKESQAHELTGKGGDQPGLYRDRDPGILPAARQLGRRPGDHQRHHPVGGRAHPRDGVRRGRWRKRARR